jgi:hypothetical protein
VRDNIKILANNNNRNEHILESMCRYKGDLIALSSVEAFLAKLYVSSALPGLSSPLLSTPLLSPRKSALSAQTGFISQIHI